MAFTVRACRELDWETLRRELPPPSGHPSREAQSAAEEEGTAPDSADESRGDDP